MLCERELDEFRGRGYVRLGKPFTDGEIREIADAYDEVLKNTEFAKQSDAVVSAHFGLAAIAECVSRNFILLEL